METLTLRDVAIALNQIESGKEREDNPNAHIPAYVELLNRILGESGECLIVESQIGGDAPFTDAQKDVLANFFLNFATLTEESLPSRQ